MLISCTFGVVSSGTIRESLTLGLMSVCFLLSLCSAPSRSDTCFFSFIFVTDQVFFF